VESVYTIKIHDKSLHRCNWQQGDIYYKPKTRFKNCDFWNWILWVVVFRLRIFLLGVFHTFFWWVVGVKNMCLLTPPPPPPHTHTFNSGTAHISINQLKEKFHRKTQNTC